MSCPACFTGTKHDHGTPKGSIEPLYGLPTYISNPPDDPNPKSTILFLTDAFGLKLINSQILADRYAAETNCKVIMPDIIPGGGASPAYIDKIATLTESVGWTDLWGQLNRIWVAVQVVPPMVAFMYRAKPAAVYPRILEYARSVKKDLPEGGKLGVAGFCWGGYGSSMLCVECSVESGSERLIDAQFCAHPSKLDFEKVISEAVDKWKVPYSMAIGDKDMALKKETVLDLQKALKEKIGEPEKHGYQIVMYESCRHGFAVRANPENKVEIAAAEKATKQAVDWFNKYVH